MNTNCLFCKIASGVIQSAKIYADEEFFAFLDIKPVNPGHTLLIPKKHSVNLYDMPDETLARIAPIIKKLATAVKNGTGADGINIGMNNDPAAGQEVRHAHIHIIPRFNGDNVSMWKGHPYHADEMEKISEKIKTVLR